MGRREAHKMGHNIEKSFSNKADWYQKTKISSY